MSEEAALMLCDRCGRVVGTGHNRPECDAFYNAAFQSAAVRVRKRPALAGLAEGWAVYEGGDHDGWFCVSPEQLREFAAEKWDAGVRAAGDQWANGDGPIKNPYRTEVDR